jgi:leucyl/phenylalanyl-tRNA--protein transferase
MTIPWIEKTMPLPPPEAAQKKGSDWPGLLAAGDDLSVERLCEAYQQGIFPWFSEGQPVLWWSPDPRMVLQIDNFKIHPSLRKTLNKFIANPTCEVCIDRDFAQVIRHCAHGPRKGQPGTWILPEMIQAYEALHAAGFAHSVETWVEGRLVGGLYAVSMGATLFGESMFAHQTDASKIALAGLVAFCRSQGIRWVDCQQNTKHLASLGAQEIPREKFLQLVRHADFAQHYDWTFKPSYWTTLFPQRSTT